MIIKPYKEMFIFLNIDNLGTTVIIMFSIGLHGRKNDIIWQLRAYSEAYFCLDFNPETMPEYQYVSFTAF